MVVVVVVHLRYSSIRNCHRNRITCLWFDDPDDRKHPSNQQCGRWTFKVNCQRDTLHTVDARNPAPVEVGSLSHYFQGFIHPRWCSISEPSTVLSSFFKPTSSRPSFFGVAGPAGVAWGPVSLDFLLSKICWEAALKKETITEPERIGRFRAGGHEGAGCCSLMILLAYLDLDYLYIYMHDFNASIFCLGGAKTSSAC